ncbi:MAG TPA: hypothetical protein VGG39_13275 [Polyangiaceae bacterium]|jgi:hypothetical protein
MRTSRALATVAILGGCAAIIGYSASALSADHQDSPATLASPTADINDVYSWVDGGNVVLAMTVYPAAPAGALFDDRVQYAFHTSSGAGFGATSTYTDVIATFDTSTPQKIQLWVGATEYLTGDPSGASGLSSADGKVKVFAGLRADPFFFNLDGFKNTVATVESVASTLTFNDAGCPGLNGGQQTLLGTELATAPDGGAPVDHFATFDGLAIVVSVNKALLTTGGPVMSVWAGTYATTSLTDAGGQ